jgi:prepilin-type N-terminal cleavage/methylation domain-containing protein
MEDIRGFTLIELIAVVSIIGLLTYVAISNFNMLLEKSKEATTKGHLGMLRSSLSTYYTNYEGRWPQSLHSLVPDYIDKIPPVSVRWHTSTTEEYLSNGSEITETPDAAGKWYYNNLSGMVKVNCTHTDLERKSISSW